MIISLLIVGNYMTTLPGGDEKLQIYTMHKSFGMIILGLVLIRLIVRLRSAVPNLPEGIKPFDAKLSSIAVFLLYCGMLMMPLSGYVMSMAGNRGINFLGMFQLPNLIGTHPNLATLAWQAHGIIGASLATLILLHIVGSLKHLVVDKINIFKRMI